MLPGDGRVSATARTIAHVDMDAFFASIEALRRPEYRGKPLIVGGDPQGRRGVVSTCSYEARAYGVRSAMPIREAVRRCPHAIFVRPDMKTYAEYSRRVHEVLSEFTPVIEPLSIDEAFLDMTGCEHFYQSLEHMGEAIKGRIRERTGLTASVGIAHNKFLAKLASDSGKPDGLVVLRPSEATRFLDPLPVRSLWGVGPKTSSRLAQLGVATVKDLRERSLPWLKAALGEAAANHLFRLCRGQDDRDVVPEQESKSISRETTFEEDVRDPETLVHVLAVLVADVGARLRRARLFAGAVQIKVRYPDFRTLTRRRSLPHATDSDERLYKVAKELLEQVGPRAPVRLLGVGVAELTQSVQTSLFADDARSSAIDRTLDRLTQQFGERIVRPGREWAPLPGKPVRRKEKGAGPPT